MLYSSRWGPFIPKMFFQYISEELISAQQTNDLGSVGIKSPHGLASVYIKKTKNGNHLGHFPFVSTPIRRFRRRPAVGAERRIKPETSPGYFRSSLHNIHRRKRVLPGIGIEGPLDLNLPPFYFGTMSMDCTGGGGGGWTEMLPPFILLVGRIKRKLLIPDRNRRCFSAWPHAAIVSATLLTPAFVTGM
jgi:hypothetical protein